MIRYVSLFAVLGLVGCGSDADTVGSKETVTNCQIGMITGAYLSKAKLRTGTSGCPGDFEQVVQFGGPDTGCQAISKIVDVAECSVTGTVTCDTGGKVTTKLYQRNNAGTLIDGVATIELTPDICTYDLAYDRL